MVFIMPAERGEHHPYINPWYSHARNIGFDVTQQAFDA